MPGGGVVEVAGVFLFFLGGACSRTKAVKTSMIGPWSFSESLAIRSRA